MESRGGDHVSDKEKAACPLRAREEIIDTFGPLFLISSTGAIAKKKGAGSRLQAA
jgi:hypothetical protein